MICKICNNDFTPKRHNQKLCSQECKDQNTKLIKSNYYKRNTELVKFRSKQRKENGYKWIIPEHIKLKRKAKSRIRNIKFKNENKEKYIQKYTRCNNSEKRKIYMKEYYENNKIAASINRKKYRSKKTTKSIISNDHLKRKYGITIQDYEMMSMNQLNLCAICQKPETRKVSGKQVSRLAVDHCHKTGVVRGLLCFKCNCAIGKMEDSVENLRRAIEYLEKSKN